MILNHVSSFINVHDSLDKHSLLNKTKEVLEKIRPRSFSIESIDECSYQPEFSLYVEDFDWDKLKDEG